MRRVGLVICLLWTSAPWALGQKPTAAETQATIAWLTHLQKASGGFSADAKPDTPATLPATLSAVRALHYFGSSAPHADQIPRFLRSCWNENEGGFAPTPGGKPDVRTTAVALMGLVDLNAADQNQDFINRGMAYLGEHVKDYEDVRIAAAAFESNHKSIPQIKKWQDILRAFPTGDDADHAREIGGAAVASMRLGERFTKSNMSTILTPLREAQRPEGAWGKAGAAPDLETSYRVMRAFFMLKAGPKDADALRKFIGRCRLSDGSYAVAPGQPASVSGAYYAGIISYWLDRLEERGKPS
jgi:prenyltransferase beta subunit